MKLRTSKYAAFTLVEALTAGTITAVILGGVIAATMALQRSFLGNRTYTKSITDSNRVLDYFARDLRNATAISRRTNGTSTAFKFPAPKFEIKANDELCIFVPNYYDSNTPDNSSGSAYKRPYFSRGNLAAGQEFFPYDKVVRIEGITRVANYPGTLEIRYVKKARAAGDSTVCFFRSEIEAGTVRQTEEIAERAEGQTVEVSIPTDDNYQLQLTSSFSSPWTAEKYRSSSRQFNVVKIENFRTDLR